MKILKRVIAFILVINSIVLFASCTREGDSKESGVISTSPDTEEAVTPNASETDPPVTEPPATEPPVTEPPVTEPPVTEVPDQTEKPEEAHVCDFVGEWQSDGTEHWKLCACGAKGETATHTVAVDPAVEPTCTETGLTEGQHCSVCQAILTAQATIEKATAHKYAERACVWCGEKEPSMGLEFQKVDEGYAVIGIGTCTDTDLVIPKTHDGLPVISIGEGAFSDCNDLTSVTIPDSVTRIGENAFYNCRKLKDVYITDVEAWRNISFGDKNSYPNFYGTLHALDAEGKEVTELVIPNGVTSIGDFVFRNFKSLTGVTIPNSVTRIGNYAFYGCPGLTTITYTGTMAEWNAVSKGASWLYSVPATEVICSDGNEKIPQDPLDWCPLGNRHEMENPFAKELWFAF